MTQEKRGKKRAKAGWWKLLKALVGGRIRTGVIVLVPVAFTIWVLQLVFKWLDGLLQPLALHAIPVIRRVLAEYGFGKRPVEVDDIVVRVTDVLERHDRVGLRSLLGGLDAKELRDLVAKVPADELIVQLHRLVPSEVWLKEDVIPGAGLVALLLLLYTVGFLTSVAIGGRVVGMFDRFLERVPISRTIYAASKQIVKTFGDTKGSQFQRAALIPYPYPPLNSLAFVTNTFRDELTKKEMCCVFLPTTPNPTSGYYLIVPAEDVRDVALDVEQAVGLIMSGGIMLPSHAWTLPPQPKPPAGADEPEEPAEA